MWKCSCAIYGRTFARWGIIIYPDKNYPDFRDYNNGTDLCRTAHRQKISKRFLQQVATLDFDVLSQEMLNCSDPLLIDALIALSEEDSKRKPPIVPKNDIRRYIPTLFVNALNANDQKSMLNFLSAFMIDDTNCTIHNNFVLNNTLPSIMHLTGFRMFMHYYIGMGIMFPDMTMTLQNYSIVTHINSPQTQLKMNFVFKSTHVANIPFDLWIPPQQSLEHLYNILDPVILEEQLNEYFSWCFIRMSTRTSCGLPEQEQWPKCPTSISANCTSSEKMYHQTGNSKTDKRRNIKIEPRICEEMKSTAPSMSRSVPHINESISARNTFLILQYFYSQLMNCATPAELIPNVHMDWCVEMIINQNNKIERMNIYSS